MAIRQFTVQSNNPAITQVDLFYSYNINYGGILDLDFNYQSQNLTYLGRHNLPYTNSTFDSTSNYLLICVGLDAQGRCYKGAQAFQHIQDDETIKTFQTIYAMISPMVSNSSSTGPTFTLSQTPNYTPHYIDGPSKTNNDLYWSWCDASIYYGGGTSSHGAQNVVVGPYRYNNLLYGTVERPMYSTRLYGSILDQYYQISPVNGTTISYHYQRIIGTSHFGQAYSWADGKQSNIIPGRRISGRYRFGTNISGGLLAGFSIPCNYTVIKQDETYEQFYALKSNGVSDRFPENKYCGITCVNDTHDVVLGSTSSSSTSATLPTAYQNCVFDFGDVPQNIPENIYNWIVNNSTYLYPYTYIIKSSDGETLATLTEAPSMRNVSVSTIGNTVNVVLTGSNGQTYNMTYQHTIPTGKHFYGFGYSPSDPIASIPTGQSTAVEWDDDMTLYEIVENLNTYTVKSSDGEVITELTNTPPIRDVTVSASGNTVNIVMTGANGQTYNMSYQRTIPDGKYFYGLGYSPDDLVASVPTGRTTSVLWDNDITLYDLIGERAPVSAFDINLYQNNAEPTRVDKSNDLVSVGVIQGTLRDECNITTPTIVIELEKFPKFNYVYIEAFNRYYYVTAITSVATKLWRIELNCDVLMSYKDEIMSLSPLIERQENTYNAKLNDSEMVFEEYPLEQIITPQISSTPEITFSNAYGYSTHNYCLSCLTNVIYDQQSLTLIQTHFDSNATWSITNAELRKFISELNNPSFLDALKNLFGNAPMEAIIGLYAYPFDVKVLLGEGDEEDAPIGIASYRTSANGRLIVQKVTENMYKQVCWFDLSGYGGSWYQANDVLRLYIPYHGFVDLDPELVYRKRIYVYININFDNGSATWLLRVGDPLTTQTTIKIFKTQLGIQIPLSSTDNSSRYLKSLSTAISGGLQAGANPTALATAIPALISTFQPHVSSIGTGSSDDPLFGLRTEQQPFIIRYYKTPIPNQGYSLKGYPLEEVRALNTLTGYTKVRDVHLEDFGTATQDECTEIERLLKSGVIL